MFLSSRYCVLVYALLLYTFMFAAVCVYWKPSLMFDEHGAMRKFGVGYKQTTILPVWMFAVLAGIFCYLAVIPLVSNTCGATTAVAATVAAVARRGRSGRKRGGYR